VTSAMRRAMTFAESTTTVLRRALEPSPAATFESDNSLNRIPLDTRLVDHRCQNA